MTNPNKFRRIIPAILLAAAGSSACSGGEVPTPKDTTQNDFPTCHVGAQANPQDPFNYHFDLGTQHIGMPDGYSISDVEYSFGDESPSTHGPASQAHTYETSGSYVVAASVALENGDHKELPAVPSIDCTPVTVHIAN